MGKPFQIALGPFEDGLVNAVDPALLGVRPQDLYNVRMDRGVLEGLPALGEEVSNTTILDPLAVHYAAGTRWVADAPETWFLDDGDQTLRTVLGQSPQILTPTQTFQLGYSPPVSMLWAYPGGGSAPAGDHDFVFVFRTGDNQRSNPSTRIRLNFSGTVKFHGISTPDLRITAIEMYKTKDSAPDGLLFFVKEWQGNTIPANDPTGLVYDGSVLPDPSRPLTWGYGGSKYSQAMPEDHAPAPILTHLSNVMHSATGGTSSGSRIWFGAVGSEAVWSRKGFINYCPTVNREPLPGAVEAVLTQAAQTIYLLQEGLWLASGTDDRSIGWSQANIGFGCKLGCGRAAAITPYGVMFPAREGLAVWNASMGQIVSGSIFSDTFWRSLSIRHARYFDGAYWLFCADQTFRLDLTAWPKIRCIPVWKKDGSAKLIVTAANVTDWSEPVYARTLQPLNVDSAAGANTTDRRRGAMVVAGTFGTQQRVYVLGGEYFSGVTVDNMQGGLVTNKVGEYSIALGRWRNMTVLGNNLRDAAACVYNAKIYLQGGYYATFNYAPNYPASLVEYDPADNGATGGVTNTWNGGNRPAKFGHAGGLAGSVWYLFGGSTNIDNPNTGSLDTLHKIDLASPSSDFTVLPPSGRRRVWPAAAMLNGKFYVFFGLGNDNALKNDIQIFDPTANGGAGAWTFDDTSAGAAAVFNRYRHVAWADPNRVHSDGRPNGAIYILCGQGYGSDILSDLWEYAPASGIYAAKWTAHAGAVVNFGERGHFNAGIIGQVAYAYGGRSRAALWNSDFYQIDFASMQDGGKEPGLFLTTQRAQGDSANRTYRALAGGASKWTFQTGDMGEPEISHVKRWRCLCLENKGRVDVEVFRDGALVLTSKFKDNQLGTVDGQGNFIAYPAGQYQAGFCRMVPGQGRTLSVKFTAPLVDGNGKLDANGTATGVLRRVMIDGELLGE